MKILQIANYTEGVGGISVQVKLIRDHLVSEGVPCEILSTKGNPLKRLLSVLRLCFRGKKFDVFHVHACSNWGFFPAVIGVSIGRLLKKRVVLTFHGGGAEAFFRHRTRFVRYYLTRTDANIVLSGFIGRIYDEFSIPYTVIPNFIELKDNVFRERNVIGARFICIRSLSPLYNIPCILRAFAQVKKCYPEASLVLLGDGNSRKELESFVSENGIQDVKFVGRVPNADIHQYLSQADIMLSSPHFDNMPVSILEGFCSGLLVISSRVGGVPYMIEDGVNGLLFDDDNDSMLFEKVVYALKHQDASKQMIKNAYGQLVHYSWTTYKIKYLGLCQS